MAAQPPLDLVASFVAVAEDLSFRRAAERLALDPSALSRRIARLEHALGFRLLERTTREVELTPAGRVVYEDNRALLARFASGIAEARRVADGKAGHLRIAYMTFAAPALMPAAVAAFRARHPHVALTLRYMRTQGQKLALANGEADLGFLIGPFSHSDFDTLPLASDRLAVVAPPGDPLLARESIAPADLKGRGLVLGDLAEWGEYRYRLADLFGAAGVRLEVCLETSDALAIGGLVAAGLGPTVYPESLAGLIGSGLAARPIDDPLFRIETVLAWKRTNRGAAVRAFVAAARGLRRAQTP